MQIEHTYRCLFICTDRKKKKEREKKKNLTVFCRSQSKIHKITPATDKERGDIEIKDYAVLQKPQEQSNRLPPPRTLILDFTMIHTCYGRSIQHTTSPFTHTRRSDGVPESGVDTSDRIYDYFNRLLFLHDHREESVLVNDERTN